MSSGWIKRLLAYVVFLVLLQVPMLHGWVLFDVAFPFPYVGFLLLVSHAMPRGWLMTLAFCIGLVMDVFSNTPGMHASASVLMCYMRSWWFGNTLDMGDDDLDLTLTHLGWVKFALALLPLIFIHHLTLFVFENEGFNATFSLLGRVFWSTLYSYALIILVAFATAPKKKR
jgi:hypothetical protein